MTSSVAEATPGRWATCGHRTVGVDDGVESVGRHEPWERGFRPATRGRGGQHQPADDADQERDGQPGPPPAAQPGVKRHPDGSHGPSSCPPQLAALQWGFPRWPPCGPRLVVAQRGPLVVAPLGLWVSVVGNIWQWPTPPPWSTARSPEGCGEGVDTPLTLLQVRLPSRRTRKHRGRTG